MRTELSKLGSFRRPHRRVLDACVQLKTLGVPAICALPIVIMSRWISIYPFTGHEHAPQLNSSVPASICRAIQHVQGSTSPLQLLF